jgi:hypothetical protein
VVGDFVMRWKMALFLLAVVFLLGVYVGATGFSRIQVERVDVSYVASHQHTNLDYNSLQSTYNSLQSTYNNYASDY